MSEFQSQQLGITAFMASNRIDFVLDGPEMDSPERCSAFYDNPKAKLKLQAKGLKITSVVTDEESGEPVQLQVKWGRETLKLGRRQNASGPVSFYRSLETANNVGAPKTAKQILDKLEAFTS